MGISKSGGGRKVGEIFDHSGTVAPPGAMALPIAQTNASRTAYAKLFLAIGITWGAGDGVNTFGLPWMKPDHAAVQANGNVGTETVGQNLSHIHNIVSGLASYATYTGLLGPGNSTAGSTDMLIQASGGTHNLAAGVRLLKCIQYL